MGRWPAGPLGVSEGLREREAVGARVADSEGVADTVVEYDGAASPRQPLPAHFTHFSEQRGLGLPLAAKLRFPASQAEHLPLAVNILLTNYHVSSSYSGASSRPKIIFLIKAWL